MTFLFRAGGGRDGDRGAAMSGAPPNQAVRSPGGSRAVIPVEWREDGTGLRIGITVANSQIPCPVPLLATLLIINQCIF